MANTRTGGCTVVGVECLTGYVKADTNQITIISSTGDIVPYGILNTAGDSGSISSNTIDIDVDDTDYNHYGIYTSGGYGSINGNVIDMYNNDAKDLGIYLAGGYCTGRANMTYRCGTGITDAGASNDVLGLDG